MFSAKVEEGGKIFVSRFFSCYKTSTNKQNEFAE